MRSFSAAMAEKGVKSSIWKEFIRQHNDNAHKLKFKNGFIQ